MQAFRVGIVTELSFIFDGGDVHLSQTEVCVQSSYITLLEREPF